jgi:radical SAM superfamily enzyme YgiQ (UPF0313 family)
MAAGLGHDALEPYVFAVLSGRTPSGVETVLYDEMIETIPVEERTDLVAMTVETSTARRAYRLARAYHERGVPVVMGGHHPTLLAEEALGYATAVVRGDGEQIWPEVVRDAMTGKLRRLYEGRSPSMGGLRVDRTIFARKRYRGPAIVQFGRGCPYSCEFCSISAFYGSALRRRPVDEVAGEFARIDRSFVFFADDNLFTHRKAVAELCASITPFRKRWVCQASVDIADDPALVRLMARSGCVCVLLGLESLNMANLHQMNKNWSGGPRRYAHAIRTLADHGIMTYGTFVFGYDQDAPDGFEQTLNFALRNKLVLANFNPLAPTPGTRLLDRLRREGRLIHDPWWLHEDYRYGQAFFHPRGMTAEELEAGCYRARTEFNRFSSMAQRFFDFRANARTLANALTFWLANITSRRQIHRKQGTVLGGAGPVPSPIYKELVG